MGCAKNLLPVTALMVVSPAAVWHISVAPTLSSIGATLLVALLLALCLAALVFTWLTEPGILHVITHDHKTWYIHDRCTGHEYKLVEFRAKFCRETGTLAVLQCSMLRTMVLWCARSPVLCAW